MALFRYVGLDGRGQRKSGEIDASTPRQARQMLQAQGIFATDVAALGSALGLSELLRRSPKELLQLELTKGRIPTAELSAFTRQFATLISAEIPIIPALDALTEQTTHRGLASALRAVRKQVNEGSALADALAQHPHAFSDLYVNMVMAAEKSGRLGPVLTELAALIEDRQRLTGEVRAALTYPVLMLVVGLGIVVYLLTSVVPQITGLFADLGRALPTPTVVLMAISDAVRLYGPALLVLFVGAAVGARWAIQRHPAARLKAHSALLRAPVLGPFFRKLAVARFAATLASLLQARVPLMAALEIAEKVTPFVPYQNAVAAVRTQVAEGGALSVALRDTGLFPSLLVNMVAVGEQTNQVDALLGRLAGALQAELRATLTGMTALIQPLMLLFMGGLIAFIMAAVLLPIFDLNTLAAGS